MAGSRQHGAASDSDATLYRHGSCYKRVAKTAAGSCAEYPASLKNNVSLHVVIQTSGLGMANEQQDRSLEWVVTHVNA